MCADMSRIEWEKDKNKSKNKSNTKHSSLGKGHKATKNDCSSATAFFNFLTQR